MTTSFAFFVVYLIGVITGFLLFVLISLAQFVASRKFRDRENQRET